MIDKATVNAIIGGRIRMARCDRGLTQRGLCRAAGLSVAFLCDLEKGKRGVCAANLLAIATALDTPIGWFFGTLAPAAPGTGGGGEG